MAEIKGIAPSWMHRAQRVEGRGCASRRLAGPGQGRLEALPPLRRVSGLPAADAKIVQGSAMLRSRLLKKRLAVFLGGFDGITSFHLPLGASEEWAPTIQGARSTMRLKPCDAEAVGAANSMGPSAAMREMVARLSQSKAPTLDWDGDVLADFGVDELIPFLRQKGVPCVV